MTTPMPPAPPPPVPEKEPIYDINQLPLDPEEQIIPSMIKMHFAEHILLKARTNHMHMILTMTVGKLEVRTGSSILYGFTNILG
jgi:hypothetical protein